MKTVYYEVLTKRDGQKYWLWEETTKTLKEAQVAAGQLVMASQVPGLRIKVLRYYSEEVPTKRKKP